MATATITDNGTWQTEADIPEKERYGRYLASREWGLLREQVKKRSGGVCERCKLNKSDAVHHLTYERKYHEELNDLQDICDGCHKFTHGKSNDDPRGVAVIVSGAFVSASRIFVFFDTGSHMPESEVFLSVWSWEAADLMAMLCVELPENKNYRRNVPLHWLIGRKYWATLGNCPSDTMNLPGCVTAIRSRQESVEADDEFKPYFSFVLSFHAYVDAS